MPASMPPWENEGFKSIAGSDINFPIDRSNTKILTKPPQGFLGQIQRLLSCLEIIVMEAKPKP